MATIVSAAVSLFLVYNVVLGGNKPQRGSSVSQKPTKPAKPISNAPAVHEEPGGTRSWWTTTRSEDQLVGAAKSDAVTVIAHRHCFVMSSFLLHVCVDCRLVWAQHICRGLERDCAQAFVYDVQHSAQLEEKRVCKIITAFHRQLLSAGAPGQATASLDWWVTECTDIASTWAGFFGLRGQRTESGNSDRHCAVCSRCLGTLVSCSSNDTAEGVCWPILSWAV